MTFCWKYSSAYAQKSPKMHTPNTRTPHYNCHSSATRWRAVLLASPRMWTNITVICCSIKASRDDEPGPAEHAHHAMIQEEITNLYVQRSRGWFISIFVCKSTKSPRLTDPPPSIRMFPISDKQIDLLCQATDWKEISFLSTDHSRHGEARSWRRLLEKGASCCKTVDTVVLSENSTKLHNSPAFSLASNLHNLYVHGYGCCRGLVHESLQSDFPFNKIRLLAINSFPIGGKIEADGLPVTHSALSTCSRSLRSFTLEKVPIRPSTLINILSVVPGLTHLELCDLVPGSFIPYCPVSQVLATYMETNPMFLADLEAVALIWQREDTEGKLEKALIEMVEMRRVYGKLKELFRGEQIRDFQDTGALGDGLNPDLDVRVEGNSM
ncbi:hypothetical protein EDD85DRAFT_795748 [Armillaria nabsnona]|nr:hypothetical protein EDD85DRAFT_795748 [Armillaria nabsnona]